MTRLPVSDVRASLSELEQAGVALFDPRAQVLWVPSALDAPLQVTAKEMIAVAAKEIPDSHIKDAAIAALRKRKKHPLDMHVF